MPLSSAKSRTLSHTRVVTCKGYQRGDGLWDIEGHIVDTKPFSFANKDRGGEILAGEPLHEMWVRISVDDKLRIHEAESCSDYAPYHYCYQVEMFIHQLVGEQIGPGWIRQTRKLMGGNQGCIHITELLGPVATTAFQTLATAKMKSFKRSTTPPPHMNTCHAMQQDSPVVKEHWPQFYRKQDLE